MELLKLSVMSAFIVMRVVCFCNSRDDYLSRNEFLSLCEDVFVKCVENEQSLITLVDRMLKLLDTDQVSEFSLYARQNTTMFKSCIL